MLVLIFLRLIMLFLCRLLILLFWLLCFNNSLSLLGHELEFYRVVLVMEVVEVLSLSLPPGWLVLGVVRLSNPLLVS